MKKYVTLFILIYQTAFSDCEYMYGQYYTYGENFDLEEYIFGEDTCCEEYFLPMCGDDRVYFEKEALLFSSQRAGKDMVHVQDTSHGEWWQGVAKTKPWHPYCPRWQNFIMEDRVP